MFDAQTSKLLQEAPSLDNLDSSLLPKLLTQHYAELVSLRLQGQEIVESVVLSKEWPLERIADVYETVASIHEDSKLRKSSAFVSGTARLILARSKKTISEFEEYYPLSRDKVYPSVSAAILFLAAEQYADAFEAEKFILDPKGPKEIKILGLHIKDLVTGRLNHIINRSNEWRSESTEYGDIQDNALRALSAIIVEGIELLSCEIMSLSPSDALSGKYKTSKEAFQHVITLSSKKTNHQSISILTTYAGPSHLASLLLLVSDSLEYAALTKIPPPDGIDESFWEKWISWRANSTPFLWPNHREAINKQFYQIGYSSVLVLPTGAGKTTVSTLKIAATLAKGKKVIFLVPTHALVEQVTEDLQEIFPKHEFGLNISDDYDSLFVDDSYFKEIEVMTPERCLAMLSFNPESFSQVGLLVFDECHLLSPQSSEIGRSLDGMLCILTFHKVVPEADMLFLSAMLKNGEEFAEWIENLTKRPCISINLLWKPSRQARGVVVYREQEIKAIQEQSFKIQNKIDIQVRKKAKSLRTLASKELKAVPYAIWGLQNNWLHNNSFAITKILNEPIQLSGRLTHNSWNKIWINPNVNQVAAHIALRATKANLKTIVFVNRRDDAVSTSKKISELFENPIEFNDQENKLWNSLALELGDQKHAIFKKEKISAVPHHASMLRIERMLAESLFRRENGSSVIVATPTLAQGLNLPANFAILAGDKRIGNDQRRENLETHELLNAAARAGRAGHLANGVVLLISEPVMTFSTNDSVSGELQKKLLSILPENDQCVTISDPLEIILDRISEGELNNRDVKYVVNRFVSLDLEVEKSIEKEFFSESYGKFLAMKHHYEKDYEQKVQGLKREIQNVIKNEYHKASVKISAQSGLSLSLLERLHLRLTNQVGNLPISIKDWIDWTFSWLIEDFESLDELLQKGYKSALTSVGKTRDNLLNESDLKSILKAIHGWIEGEPLNVIEVTLGGNPDGSARERFCPRSRELTSVFIPRGISFILMIITRMIDELNLYSLQENLDKTLVASLSSAVRRGFDTVDKLEFSNNNKHIRGRVETHIIYRDK